MTFDYDSEEIKNTARRIKSISSNIKDLSSRDIPKILAEVDSGLKGQTANALSDTLQQILRDINQVSGGLNRIQSELYAFARRVEIADAQMAKRISEA